MVINNRRWMVCLNESRSNARHFWIMHPYISFVQNDKTVTISLLLNLAYVPAQLKKWKSVIDNRSWRKLSSYTLKIGTKLHGITVRKMLLTLMYLSVGYSSNNMPVKLILTDPGFNALESSQMIVPVTIYVNGGACLKCVTSELYIPVPHPCKSLLVTGITILTELHLK